jgi:hypothetical protein
MVSIRVQTLHKRRSAGCFRRNARGNFASPRSSSSSAVRLPGPAPKIRLTNVRDALQTLTSTRQTSVLNAFLDALTRGGPNGLPRPIELHAHDPTRYVGDMLAWVHQATASEHEFLDQLFGVKDSNRMVGSARNLTGWEEMARECLDRNLEGVCRPLKVG